MVIHLVFFLIADVYALGMIAAITTEMSSHDLVPPRIVEGPPATTQYLSPHQDVSLVCHVTGKPAPTLDWRHNNSPLDVSQLGTCLHMDTADPGNLILRLRADFDRERCESILSGPFQCFASSDAGTAFSNVTLLAPAYLYSDATGSEDKTLTLPLGGALKLNASEIHSVPQANTTFKWEFRREGTDQWRTLRRAENSWIHPQEGVFIILSVTASDAGQYRCRADNTLTGNGVEDPPWTLRVSAALTRPSSFDPTLVDRFSSPEVVTVWKDSLVLLKSFLFGSPNVDILWSVTPGEPCPEQDERAIHAFQRVVHGDYNSAGGRQLVNKSGRVLVLTKVQPEQGGCYQTIAHGPGHAGFYVKRTRLVVQVPLEARLTEYPSIQLVEGGTRAFTCELSGGHPSPVVTWYLNDTEYSPAVHFNWHLSDVGETLTLRNADFSDTAVVTCSVSNSLETILVTSHVVVTLGGDDTVAATVSTSPSSSPIAAIVPTTVGNMDGNDGNQGNVIPATTTRPSTMGSIIYGIIQPDESYLTDSGVEVGQQNPHLQGNTVDQVEESNQWHWIIPVICCACALSAALSAIAVYMCVRRRKSPATDGYDQAPQTQMMGAIVIDSRRGAARMRRSLSTEGAKLQALSRVASVEDAEQLQRLNSIEEVTDRPDIGTYWEK